MANIPDFVLQVQEVERQLLAQLDDARQDWGEGDVVRQRFEEQVFEPYCQKIRDYLDGTNIKDEGLNALMVSMSQHLDDMSELTGLPSDVAFACAAGAQNDGLVGDMMGREIDAEGNYNVVARGGIVHTSRGSRDYWGPNNGPAPGQLVQGDIKEIENNRE